MPTLSDALTFVRNYNLLQGWTDAQIVLAMEEAIHTCAFSFTLNEEGKLKGIVFGKWQDNCSTLHITCIAGEKQLPIFIKALRETFPQCKKLKAFRYGKPQEYLVNQDLKVLKESN